MRLHVVIVLSWLLISCTVSPERKKAAEDYSKLAQAERRQAAAHGQNRGTPENIEGINRAQNRAVKFEQAASEKRESFFWKILESIFDKSEDN